MKTDPITATLYLVMQDMEALMTKLGVILNDEQVRTAVNIQVSTHHGAGIKFLGGAQQKSKIVEAFTLPVEKKIVMLKSIP